MILTIGMACRNNIEDVFFTTQSLRAYHDLSETEILVVDNHGDDSLKDWIDYWGKGDKDSDPRVVRYVRWLENHGTEPPREIVFRRATGKFVLCIDSHVLLMPGVVEKLKSWIRTNPSNSDLIQGPMVSDDLKTCILRMRPEWNCSMWGVWDDAIELSKVPSEPFEIDMMGLGLFGCFKDKWLGFNMDYSGFGGGEGYIHRKYQLAGRKVLCVPWLQWVHRAYSIGAIPYPLNLVERIRNYLIGFTELGLDKLPIYDHFGRQVVGRVANGITTS